MILEEKCTKKEMKYEDLNPECEELAKELKFNMELHKSKGRRGTYGLKDIDFFSRHYGAPIELWSEVGYVCS